MGTLQVLRDAGARDAELTIDELIDMAGLRIMSGHGLRRIPAEASDVDLVLEICKDEIADQRARAERLAAALRNARDCLDGKLALADVCDEIDRAIAEQEKPR